MRPTLLVAMLLASWELSPAVSAEECSITLQIMGKEIWTVQVTPEGLKGDTNSLSREDNIVYGFIGGNRVRWKIEEEGSEGTLTGGGDILRYTKGSGYLKLFGSTADILFSVEASSDKLVLGNKTLLLPFTRQKSKESQGPVDLLDGTGHVRLGFTACAWAQLFTRPEVGLMLQQTVLDRVSEFENLTGTNKPHRT